MLRFISVFGLSCEKTIWQGKYLKASGSAFSFYRGSELFGSSNCISGLSLKKRHGIVASVLQRSIKGSNHPVALVKPKNEVHTKKNAQELSFTCLFFLSFYWRSLGLRLQSFTKSFSPWFPCPGTKVGQLCPIVQAVGSHEVGTGMLSAERGAGAKLLQAGPSSAVDSQLYCQPAACAFKCTPTGFHWCGLGLGSSQWCWLACSVGAGRTLWIVPSLPCLGLAQKWESMKAIFNNILWVLKQVFWRFQSIIIWRVWIKASLASLWDNLWLCFCCSNITGVIQPACRWAIAKIVVHEANHRICFLSGIRAAYCRQRRKRRCYPCYGKWEVENSCVNLNTEFTFMLNNLFLLFWRCVRDDQ